MRSSKSRSRNKSNRNRPSGSNVINRVFDSSGPEGKVRGTPQQIIDKYNQLARDAQLANDRVATENFQQHAEHYMRLLSEAQREMDARREEQERQNRERQAERDRERAERQEQREAQQQQQQPARSEDPAQAPQPDVLSVEDPSDAGDTGLVETPEGAAAPAAEAAPDADAPVKKHLPSAPRARAPRANLPRQLKAKVQRPVRKRNPPAVRLPASRAHAGNPLLMPPRPRPRPLRILLKQRNEASALIEIAKARRFLPAGPFPLRGVRSEQRPHLAADSSRASAQNASSGTCSARSVGAIPAAFRCASISGETDFSAARSILRR